MRSTVAQRDGNGAGGEAWAASVVGDDNLGHDGLTGLRGRLVEDEIAKTIENGNDSFWGGGEGECFDGLCDVRMVADEGIGAGICESGCGAALGGGG